MKKTVFAISLGLFLVPFSALKAQMPMPEGMYKIHLTDSNRLITAEIKPLEFTPKKYINRFYYWYSSNAIKKTQGGYSGKLLNGLYVEYWPNKNLREQGNFYGGLKDKEWSSWSENGFLLRKVMWKMGEKSGVSEYFDEFGNLKERRTYSHNILSPHIQYFGGKDTVTQKHKDLTDTTRSRSSFFARLHLFGAKKKDSLKAKP